MSYQQYHTIYNFPTDSGSRIWFSNLVASIRVKGRYRTDNITERIIRTCNILENIVRTYNILVKIVRACNILENIVRTYNILERIVRTCNILANIIHMCKSCFREVLKADIFKCSVLNFLYCFIVLLSFTFTYFATGLTVFLFF